MFVPTLKDMARRTNYRDSLQSTLDVVKRGGDQPSWWNVGIVIAGVLFAGLFAFNIMTAGGDGPTTEPGDAPPVASAPADGADDTPDGEPSAAPEPDSNAPTGDTVRLAGTVAGTTHDVPKEAYEVARQALRGFYSVDEAQRVVTADGEGFPVPPTTYSTVTFTELTVQQASDDRIAFVGKADPDGLGPEDEVVHSIAVVNVGGAWGFTSL